MDCTPKRIITDFDTKIMGGDTVRFLQSKGCAVSSSPPDHQNQNGLSKRNWQTITRMARSWLTANLLPPSYWWFAVKRATEVSNYFPVTKDGKLTTPFELVHKTKPNLCLLFPLFSVAYVRKVKDGTTKRNKFSGHSLRTIIVAKSDRSNGYTFYHPPSGQYIESIDFVLDPTLPSGSVFNIQYESSVNFNRLSVGNKFVIPSLPPSSTVYFTYEGHPSSGTILHIPTPQDPLYTIEQINRTISQHEEHELSINPPDDIPKNSPTTSPLPSWVKNDAPVTLYLPDMPKPRQGHLCQCSDGQWSFSPGRLKNTHHDRIPLPTLESHFFRLSSTGRLHKGHIPFNRILRHNPTAALQNYVARHVSAKGLKSLQLPTLTKHNTLDPNDKEIWDASYREEYEGLQVLDTWTLLSEQEYSTLKHIYGTPLPSMAIDCIKYDADGTPKRAKYRIVALGNLDSHEWTKDECFAPVLSQLKLRILVSLAIHNRRRLKNCDIKQAFCQSCLPNSEKYVVRPPPGCPLTPRNTYLLSVKHSMASVAALVIGSIEYHPSSKVWVLHPVPTHHVSSLDAQYLINPQYSSAYMSTTFAISAPAIGLKNISNLN